MILYSELSWFYIESSNWEGENGKIKPLRFITQGKHITVKFLGSNTSKVRARFHFVAIFHFSTALPVMLACCSVSHPTEWSTNQVREVSLHISMWHHSTVSAQQRKTTVTGQNFNGFPPQCRTNVEHRPPCFSPSHSASHFAQHMSPQCVKAFSLKARPHAARTPTKLLTSPRGPSVILYPVQ